MEAPVTPIPETEPKSVNTEPAINRVIIHIIYLLSLSSLLIPLGLLSKAYFFAGNKQDFVKSCTNAQQLVPGNQAKGFVEISRVKQLKDDICENIIWKNNVDRNVSWAWNLFFIVLPISSTVILAVEDNPKLKAVFVAITSASTVLASGTQVNQWYRFQGDLASEGSVLVSRINYGANTSQEFKERVKEYQNLISRSSVGQPSRKSDPNSSPSPNSSPGSF
jgi:hypothetical protein